MAYAANLFGLTLDGLEKEVLSGHLRCRGFHTVASAVATTDQSGGFDTSEFKTSVVAHLREGRYRLVFVLDEASAELVDLVGYLETVTPELVIDLVTVAKYDLGGTTVLVPQRVDPERQSVEAPAETAARDRGQLH